MKYQNFTLATLAQATEQEVFDQMAEHLLNQMKRSRLRRESCAYYGDGNLRCTAGCFIAPNEYEKSMEGVPWETLAYRQRVPHKHTELIAAGQRLHDNHPVDVWKVGLEELACSYGLEFKNDYTNAE